MWSSEEFAEWAGFTTEAEKRHDSMSGREFEGNDYTVFYSISPDGSRYGLTNPDFLNDVGACFEWLVPKMRTIVTEGELEEVLKAWIEEVIHHSPNLEVPDYKPAFWLCHVLEAVIKKVETMWQHGR